MMQIHKTQNLGLFDGNQPTNNKPIENGINGNLSNRFRMYNLKEQPDTYESSVTFKGKKEFLKNGVKLGKKAVSKETSHRFLDSRFLKAFLDVMEHEVFVQSAISAIVCMGLRPLTILALPSKKDKQDNIYASAHSISSGWVGIMSSVLISVPFTKGIKYTQKNMLKNVKENILERMYPQLDTKSIWKDASTKAERLDTEFWKDKAGNVFSTDLKKPLTVAKPKHLSEVSEETLKTLGVDIDLAAMKDKPVSEWKDRSGNDILSKLELRDMFVAINEEGFCGAKKDGTVIPNYFSLKHVDKDFLKEAMPNLDIASIEKDGKRLHVTEWKNVDGTNFKLDPDSIHISSYRETEDSIPLITGRKRVETKGGKEKYVVYQTNNLTKEELDALDKLKDDEKTKKVMEMALRVPDKLGTEITQNLLDADASNNIKFKLLSWIPDIITRPFVAAGTIALIPLILKNLFHIEKAKKPEEKQEMQTPVEVTSDEVDSVEDSKKEVA
jgi:hypothetical protein